MSKQSARRETARTPHVLWVTLQVELDTRQTALLSVHTCDSTGVVERFQALCHACETAPNKALYAL